MSTTYSDLPGWTFDTDEVSAGVYEVIGRDVRGRSVSSKGLDPEALLKSCKEQALALLEKSH